MFRLSHIVAFCACAVAVWVSPCRVVAQYRLYPEFRLIVSPITPSRDALLDAIADEVYAPSAPPSEPAQVSERTEVRRMDQWPEGIVRANDIVSRSFRAVGVRIQTPTRLEVERWLMREFLMMRQRSASSDPVEVSEASVQANLRTVLRARPEAGFVLRRHRNTVFSVSAGRVRTLGSEARVKVTVYF